MIFQSASVPSGRAVQAHYCISNNNNNNDDNNNNKHICIAV